MYVLDGTLVKGTSGPDAYKIKFSRRNYFMFFISTAYICLYNEYEIRSAVLKKARRWGMKTEGRSQACGTIHTFRWI
jgi:hypothetical protein